MQLLPQTMPRPHYGWVVLAVSFLTQGLTYTVWYAFSVFFVALLAEFAWSRASAAGVFSVFVVTSAASGPLIGNLVDRLGARRVIPVGAVVLAAGLVMCGRLTELWQFYLFFGLLAGLGVGSCGWIAQAAVLARWFPRSMGAVTGISSAGIGVGIFLLVPFIQSLISSMGWRSAFDTLALLVLGGIAPANLLLQSRPSGREFASISANGGERSRVVPESALVVDQHWATREWTLSRALRTPRFWMLFVGSTCATFSIQLAMVHQVAYFVDLGYPEAVGAFVVGIIGIVSVFAKVTWGTLSDRVGREITFTLGMAGVMGSTAVLLLAGGAPAVWMPYLFGLLIGVGYAVIAPLSPATAADLFKGHNFGTIFGALGIANGLGSAIGPWFAGLIFDVTGSYQIAFLLGLAGSSLAIVAYWIAAPRRVRRVPGSLRMSEREKERRREAVSG